MFDISKAFETAYTDFITGAQEFLPKFLWAMLIIAFGLLIARWVYVWVIYVFKKFKIAELLNKLQVNISDDDTVIKAEEIIDEEGKKIKKSMNFFGEKIKIDSIFAKALSYYIFLVFFRMALTHMGVDEVEEFVWSIIDYLPKLFIWIVIWFFWVRFASFVHDVLYHALDLTKQNNAKVVAIIWKLIVLFFTTLAVLNHIEIVDRIIYQTVLIWFIAMISIAWGLAFGLWGKEVAKEILESFKK